MRVHGLTLFLIGLLSFAPTGAAQEDQEKKPLEASEEQEKETPDLLRFEEMIVVTASRVEQKLVNVPVSLSVISSATIESSPAQNYGDLLRTIPGLNIAQTSARDLNLTSRGATSTLATSQLALLDGRTIYQDFFGFVLWDFLPINTHEIKQIEVIRGPASAVWGANAMTGVVNIITKPPREILGTQLVIGAGGFGRSTENQDADPGALFYVNGTHAQALSERLAFKVSAGAFTQDALPRPTGTIPGSRSEYPPFENQGTTQPKLDTRFDYDFADGRQKLVFGGGIAGTDGIIHTGIGPFDIQPGSILGYGKVNYQRGNMRLNFFLNELDGDAPALLTIGPDGNPITFTFENQTYDVEFGNANVLGSRHFLSYGGNYRHNAFDISIAPRGDNRDEVGVYVQDEIFLSDHFRWILGGRVDRFDVLDHAVFSPRTTFMVKPSSDHTFRVSYNRAYRAPSFVNNFLETTIASQIDLGLIEPRLSGSVYSFPVAAVGNEELSEESLSAYEVGYTGLIAGRATVNAAFYVNDTRDSIIFTQSGSYSSANPPPGWPLPSFILDLLIARGQGLPSEFTYLNFEKFRETGIEIGLDTALNQNWNVFANYSWQDEPKPTGFDIEELNIPAEHRFNVGFNLNYGRYFGNLAINYTGEAIWQDVLNYRGPTEAFTMLNGGFGMTWADGRIVTSVKGTNLTNADIQQHLFGDILKLQLVGEARFRF